MELSENARITYEKRYLKKDPDGNVLETPEDLLKRVASNMAAVERNYGKEESEIKEIEENFFQAMAGSYFLPNSPTLMNAGRDLQQLSACFVLPVKDSMEGIFTSLKHMALVQKTGGGTGFAFDRLRPAGDRVQTTNGVASGPISFLKIFDAATEAVKQGGCVDEDTRIATSQGLIKIKELGPDDTPEDSWHKYELPLKVYTDEGVKDADEFYVHGAACVRRIVTECGYTLTMTLEHRVRVINEEGEYVWKHAKDIEKGDWVALQKYTYPETIDYRWPEFVYQAHFNATEVTIPEEPTIELGEFIGYFIGDGSFSFNRRGTGRVIFTVADDEPEVMKRIVRLGKKLFSLEPVPNKKPGDSSTNLYYNSTVLAHWLHHIGVEKKSSMDAKVPEIIFRGGKDFALGFLRGLFSADGTITREGYISLSSVSRKLIGETRELLLSLGVPTRTLINKNRSASYGKNPLYRLHVVTKEGCRVFEESIGFFSSFKNDRMGQVEKGAWEFNDIIPYPQKIMEKLYDGPGRGCGPGRSPLGANRELYRDIQHYLPGVAAPRSLTRSRLAHLAQKHPQIVESPLSWFLKNDQFYDRVLSVEEDEAFTLDLSVPGNNSYVAAGFVSHNTRRGANMGSLIYNHPDILEFISCKEKEGEISNFNLSVTVSDDFMRKATGADPDPYYPLINPRSGEPYLDPDTGEVVKLHAGEVFDLIVEKAWAKGDPGIIFIEQMNRFNPTPHIGNYETTNPCVPGDTFVLTAEGPRLVEDLVGKGATLIINGKPYQTSGAGFFPTGVKPLFAIRTREGYSLRLTGDHPVLKVKKKTRYSLEKEWVRAADLGPGDEIMLHDHRGFPGWKGLYGEKEGYLMGLLTSDGTLKSDKAVLSAWQAPGIGAMMVAAGAAAFSPPHRSDFKGWSSVRGMNEYRMSTAGIKKLALSLGLGPEKAITPRLETKTSSDFARGFLRGFFDADGSVQGSREKGVSIRLAQSDLERLRAVQRMLGRCGIRCTIYENRRGRRTALLPKGPGTKALYKTRPQHVLIISGENMALFDRRIGFCNSAKKGRLNSALASYRRMLNGERFTATVEAITPGDAEPVYDVQVPGVNAFDANGFVVHNCGEQPLLPYEACCLASLNLGRFVTEGGEVDWEKLRRVIWTAVRFLDNTIDSSHYVIEEIDEMHKGNRKIGLGVMGWHDLLVRLGIPYDSEAALETAEQVMRFINEEARQCSADLASERGVFPNFEGSIYDTGKPEERVRNATRTTIAPTGTISILAGASSGIEPYFSIAFLRKNILGGVDLPEVNPLFLEIARREGFYSEELIGVIARSGYISADEGAVPARIKDLFKTAMEIDPQWHIRHQAVFQRYTDNAVSKTINLNREASPDDVKRAYIHAWEAGCKGITIYRDGSREKQVLNVGISEAESLRPSSRPATLTGHTTCIKTSLGNLFVTVNTAGGKPFELFAQIGKAGSDVVAFTEAIARLISLALRCGVGVEEIVCQLEGIGGYRSVGFGPNRIMSVPDAIGRALAGLVKVKPGENGSHHNSREICPDCGTGALVMVEGCAKCEACGYSEC